MAKFITHYNNKYELINLDLIENIYAVTNYRDDKRVPIKDSDGFFTLKLDSPWYNPDDQTSYVEKFSSIKDLEGRLEVLQRISFKLDSS